MNRNSVYYLLKFFKHLNQMKEQTEENSSDVNSEISKNRPEFALQQSINQFLRFERFCTISASGISEIITLFYILLSLAGFLLLQNNSIAVYANSILTVIGKDTLAYRLSQVIIHLLNIGMVVSLFGAKLKYRNRVWFGTVKKIVSLFSLLSRLVLCLTFFLLLISFEENLPITLLAVCISVFDALFVNNYFLRKQQNYQSSLPLSLARTVGVIINLLVSCLLVRLKSFKVYCAWGVAFGIFTFFWHGLGGYRLFVHKFSRRTLLLFCALAISNGLTFLIQLLPRKEGSEFNFVEYGVSLVVMSFYLYLVEQKNRNNFVESAKIAEDGQSPKKYDLDLFVLLEEAEEDKDCQNLLTGILIREMKACQNPLCWARRDLVYDPLFRHRFCPKEIVKEKDSLRRFVLRCIYNHTIEKAATKERLLDFIEFGVSENGDFSRYCSVLERINDQDLNFFEKIKIQKLKVLLREQSDAFNRLIHGGKVEIDEALSAEKTYEDIQKQISRYCHSNISFWSSSLEHEIDVFALKTKLAENFDLLPQINEQWNSISKFLTFHRHWRFIYLNFALFLKNEKIRNRELDFSQEPLPEIYSETEPLNSVRIRTVNESVFFEQQTTLFVCTFDEQKLRFFQTGNNFQKITGFSQHQIQGSLLDLILPLSLRDTHDTMVNDWLQNGYSTDERSYPLKSTSFISKGQQQIPAFVIFKLYVDLLCPQKPLHFGCLLRDTRQNSVDQIESGSLNVDNHKLLSSQPGKTKLHLDPVCNIFLKDDNLQPATHNTEIGRVKGAMRLTTTCLVCLVFALAFNLNTKISNISQDAKAMKIVVSLYNLPMGLARLYFNYYTSPTTSGVLSSIEIDTTSFKQLVSDPLTVETIFNSELNPSTEYGPFLANPINQGITYSSSDIFYVICSGITSLSYTPTNMSKFDFSQFHSYIKPGYDTMINTTKHLLHSQLQVDLNKLKNHQLFTILLYSTLLLIAIVYISLATYRYFSAMREIMDVVIQFSDHEIKKIAGYWQSVGDLFNTLQSKRIEKHREEENEVNDLRKSDVPGEQDEIHEQQPTASLNQKHKNLVFSKQENNKALKICALMAILMSAFLFTILSKQIVNFIKIQTLIAFEEAGYAVVKHFPTTSVAAYALGHAFYSAKFPQNEPIFNYTRFEDTMSTLQLMIDYSYLQDIDSSSPFFLKQKNYFFGNPCTYNPQILVETGTSSQQCTGAGEGSLTNGISAYLRHIQPTLVDYFTKKISMTSTNLEQLSIGLKLASYYIADAIETCYQEFKQKNEQFSIFNLFFSMILCLFLLLLHCFIFEAHLAPRLQRDYQFIRNVYETCVPDHILTQQKVTKHRFIKSGILSSN